MSYNKGCGCGCGGSSKKYSPRCSEIKFQDVLYKNYPELSCLDPEGEIKDLLDFALKVEAKICEVQGDYSLYNVHCLEEEFGYILTEERFVEAITEKVCEMANTLEDVVQITEGIDLGEIWDAINAINNPELILTNLGVTQGDTLKEILQKINNIIGEINSYTDISSVDWSSITNIGGYVDNLQKAFTVLINKIHSLENSGGADLPTFNTTNTCLPNPSASESLSSVVNKLISKICSSVHIELTEIEEGCVAIYGNTFQDYFQSIFSTLSELIENSPNFNENHFIVEPSGSSCEGMQVSLHPTVLNEMQGNQVAVYNGTNPGYLSEVLEEGDNTTFELIGDTLKINSNYKDEKVKATYSSPSAGYLEDILEGEGDITITPNANGDKLRIGVLPPTIPDMGKVFATNSDSNLGYLINKIEGQNGIVVTPNATNDKIVITGNQVNLDGKIKLNNNGSFQYLPQALEAGSNVTITHDSSSDKVKVEATNNKVAINSITEPKYLIDNLDVQDTLTSFGITVERFIQGFKILHKINANYDKITLEVLNAVENSQSLKDKFCLLVGDCGGGGGSETYNAHTIFVDASNSQTGNGSPTNPFKDLDTAISYIIGNGSRAMPEKSETKQIVVRSGKYIVGNNTAINGVTYSYNPGVYIECVGQIYFYDTEQLGSEVEEINILGFPKINAVQGGVIRIRAHEIMQGANIQLGDSTNEKGTIYMDESSYGLEDRFNNIEICGVHITTAGDHILDLDADNLVLVGKGGNTLTKPIKIHSNTIGLETTSAVHNIDFYSEIKTSYAIAFDSINIENYLNISNSLANSKFSSFVRLFNTGDLELHSNKALVSDFLATTDNAGVYKTHGNIVRTGVGMSQNLIEDGEYEIL